MLTDSLFPTWGVLSGRGTPVILAVNLSSQRPDWTSSISEMILLHDDQYCPSVGMNIVLEAFLLLRDEFTELEHSGLVMSLRELKVSSCCEILEKVDKTRRQNNRARHGWLLGLY
jgi:hypothetical protein